MRTAAGRKLQRVQLSISCQGVLTLPLLRGVWLVCIEDFAGLVSCDECESVGLCVTAINQTNLAYFD